MFQDLRSALRSFARSPGLMAAAVISLALGIGANAAIFSLFDQILLRPLPVDEPDRLVNLSAPGPKPGFGSCGQAGDCDVVFSYPMFRDLQRQQTVFTDIAAHVPFSASVAYENQPVTGDGTLVSGSYFPTLGIRPALGRLLTQNDDRAAGMNFVAVISYAYWQSRLGGDPNVLNTALRVNGKSLSIVGVAPRGFEGTTRGLKPLLFVPISMGGVLVPDAESLEDRQDYWVYLFARLKPGVTLQQASAGLNGIYHSIIIDVEAPQQKGMSDATMARFRDKKIGLEPGPRGQSQMLQETKTPLRLLFGVTAIVLLIACANIANLLLARGTGRAMEMGVRLALGASRRRLVRQLLLESMLLAVLGGVASLLVASWTLSGIAAMLPSDGGAAGLQFTLEPAVLGFAAALAIITGIAFGLFPAWHSTRAELVTTIRANAGQITGARAAARFRSGLVTLQISLATALLIAAGLFMKSLTNIARVDLGVHVDSVVTFTLSPERVGYDTTRVLQYYERVEEALASLPSVASVTSSAVPLFAGMSRSRDVNVQGIAAGPDVDASSRYNLVGANYFAALGVQPIAGREFTAADRLGAPRVAVVNQTFVKKFGLTAGAVGKFMSAGVPAPHTLSIEIVGVVPDVKYSAVKKPVPPLYYLPWRQYADMPSLSFYVRTPQPETVVGSIAAVVRSIDPGVPVEGLKTLPQQVRDNVFLDRIISILSSAFAVLATLLAAIGLYGVLAYSVAQRTREIGVRMALGADAGRVRMMVLRQVGGMMIVGGVIGLAGAVALGKAGSSLLFGLTGTDPVVFALALVLLCFVAFAAGYLPARRASQVDPMAALRTE